ncbi:MAG: GHKL domain-containing protein [Erysipelotrichaceae bacterium]|nr:GHKL domain-containing protein [Solobacterium sp.]MDY2731725.1 GHKL domain-containing protein [Erysipelotrichaceae bacterium]
MNRNNLSIQALCFYITVTFGFIYGNNINIYLSLIVLLITNIITCLILYNGDINKRIGLSIIAFILLCLLYLLLNPFNETIKSFILFVVSYIFKLIFKFKVNTLKYNQLIPVLFPLVCLFIIIELKEISDLIIILLIILCLFIFYLFDRLSKLNDIEIDKVNISNDLEIKNSELNYIKELYSSQRKMTHDYKNKLTTVKALINEGNTDKAREYTDTLLDSVIYHSKIISTNNDIVDALLNSKYYLCHSRNIVIQFKVDNLSNIPFTNDELIVILSNALDNAIEAASKCDNPFIKLKIENNKLFVISIINSSKEVITKANRIIKSHSPEHGYGLGNIKNIVDKYQGNLALDYRDGCFQLTVVVNNN